MEQKSQSDCPVLFSSVLLVCRELLFLSNYTKLHCWHTPGRQMGVCACMCECAHFLTSTTWFLPLLYLIMQCSAQAAGALHFTEGKYTTHGDLFLKTSKILTYHPQLRAYTLRHTLYTLTFTQTHTPRQTSTIPHSDLLSPTNCNITSTGGCQSFPPLPDPTASLPLFISLELLSEPCSRSSALALRLLLTMFKA